MVCTVLESTWLRSLVKGITWETTGLITVAGIALLFTGDLRQSLLIGAVYLPVRVGMYFVHERIWKHFGWGHRLVHREGEHGQSGSSFWCGLFPLSLVIDVWCLVVLYIGWSWLCR